MLRGNLPGLVGPVAIGLCGFELERSFSTAFEFAASSVFVCATSALIARLIFGLGEATGSLSHHDSTDPTTPFSTGMSLCRAPDS